MKRILVTLLVIASLALPAALLVSYAKAQSTCLPSNIGCVNQGTAPCIDGPGVGVDINNDGFWDVCIAGVTAGPPTGGVPTIPPGSSSPPPSSSSSGPDTTKPTLVQFNTTRQGESINRSALAGVVEFVFKISDTSGIGPVKLYDGATVVNQTSTYTSGTLGRFVRNVTALADGAHAWKLEYSDKAATPNTDSRTLQRPVDQTEPLPPTVGLDGPQGLKGWFLGETRLLAAAEQDSGSPIQIAYSVDGGLTQLYNATTAKFSRDGNGTIAVFAEDGAGNRATVTLPLKIETTDPVATLISRPLSVAAGTNALIRFEVKGAAPVTAASVLVGTVSHTATLEKNTAATYRFNLTTVAADAGKKISYTANVTDEAGRSSKAGPVELSVTAPGSVPVNSDCLKLSANDCDGDGYTNAEEVALGSDPTSLLSPSPQPRTITVRALGNGSIAITWTAPADAKLASFLVFRFSEPVLIAEVKVVPGQTTYTVYDTNYPGGTHTYRVMGRLATDDAANFPKTFNADFASAESAPVTAPASSAIAPVGTAGEPWLYVGAGLLLAIFVAMVIGVVRRSGTTKPSPPAAKA